MVLAKVILFLNFMLDAWMVLDSAINEQTVCNTQSKLLQVISVSFACYCYHITTDDTITIIVNGLLHTRAA